MEFKIVVIASFDVLDRHTNTYTQKVHSDVFCCLNDALDSIKSYDYPPRKISIHIISH